MRARLSVGVIGISWMIIGYLVVSDANLWAKVSSDTTPEQSVVAEPPAEIQDDTFALAEYYFNQDADSAGPYDPGLARYYYLEAAKAEPVPETLWHQLGRVDFVLGNYTSSRTHIEKQLQLFGDRVPESYYVLGLTNGYEALETGNAELWTAAEQAFLTYIMYAPKSPWPRVDLAWVYFSQEKHAAMIPHLEEGLRHNPNHAWLLNSYGLALLNTGQIAAAREQFQLAETAVAMVTEAEWGAAYSGNNPAEWAGGLEEFRQTIARNLALTEQE